MINIRISIVIGLLMLVIATRSHAQDDAGPDEGVVTERLAYPYSIDLLPDDPAPPPFEEAPGAADFPRGEKADAFGPKTVTGDAFTRRIIR